MISNPGIWWPRVNRFHRRELVHSGPCVYVQRWEFIKENKKVRKNKENTLSTKKPTKKTIKKRILFLFFFVAFLVESERSKKDFFFFFSWSLFWSRACFLYFFLDRYSFFYFSWSLFWSKACFLVFFHKFPTQIITEVKIL